MRPIETEISVSALLTIAIALLTMSVDYFKEGLVVEGAVCGVIGFGLLIGTVLLIKEGVIKELKK